MYIKNILIIFIFGISFCSVMNETKLSNYELKNTVYLNNETGALQSIMFQKTERNNFYCLSFNNNNKYLLSYGTILNFPIDISPLLFTNAYIINSLVGKIIIVDEISLTLALLNGQILNKISYSNLLNIYYLQYKENSNKKNVFLADANYNFLFHNIKGAVAFYQKNDTYLYGYNAEIKNKLSISNIDINYLAGFSMTEEKITFLDTYLNAIHYGNSIDAYLSKLKSTSSNFYYAKLGFATYVDNLTIFADYGCIIEPFNLAYLYGIKYNLSKILSDTYFTLSFGNSVQPYNNDFSRGVFLCIEKSF